MILQLLKYAMFGDERTQSGHPVNLLLMTFQRHVNASSVALLTQMKDLLPPIKQATFNVLQKAERMHENFTNSIKNSNQDLNTQLSEKEKEQLYEIAQIYINAMKMSPTCIATRMRYLQFMIRNYNFDGANELYNDILSMLDSDYDATTNPNTPNLQSLIDSKKNEQNKSEDNSSKSKKKGKTKAKAKKASKKASFDFGLNETDKEKLIRLIMFYMGYMYNMTSKYSQMAVYLKQAADRDKSDLEIRVQYCLSQVMGNSVDTSWQDMINLLQDIENYEIEHGYWDNLEEEHRKQLMKEDRKSGDNSNSDNKNNSKKQSKSKTKKEKEKGNEISKEDCASFKLYLHIGCASLILSQSESINWALVTSHLERALSLDFNKSNKLLYYVLSYSYYNNGKKEAANEAYSKFEHFIENDFRKEFEEQMKDHDHSQCGGDHDHGHDHHHHRPPTMQSFSWKPQISFQNIVEHLLDSIFAIIILALIDYMLGFRPHLGSNIIDWAFMGSAFFAAVMMIQNPAMALFALGIGLPPYYATQKQDDGTKVYVETDFDYTASIMKLVIVVVTLMLLYHVSGLKKLPFLP